MPQLILASSSKYRQQRLRDAGISFTAQPADIDETPHANEAARDLAARLAYGKAAKIQQGSDDAVIIGCDQVAEVQANHTTHILGKPGNKQNAAKQLALCSGNPVVFQTALCVIDTATGDKAQFVDSVTVNFRQLDTETINNYLELDLPFDCAGSIKMERAGILLFKSIECRDPNALLGIPMMSLVDGLQQLGYSMFDFTKGN